jgi:hypothetical protein
MTLKIEAKNKNRLDIIIKIFCAANNIISKVKRQLTKSILQIIYPISDFYPEYIKNFHSSIVKSQITQFENEEKI